MLTIKRYTASWCQPCKMLAPIMESLQLEYNNVSFVTVDVDQNREEAKTVNVTGVPAVLFIKDGREVYRFTGVKPRPFIDNIIKQYL